MTTRWQKTKATYHESWRQMVAERGFTEIFDITENHFQTGRVVTPKGAGVGRVHFLTYDEPRNDPAPPGLARDRSDYCVDAITASGELVQRVGFSCVESAKKYLACLYADGKRRSKAARTKALEEMREGHTA
jgi:hypothetical protein